MRRAVWPLLATVVLVGVLFLAVFPTRTFLGQRAAIERAEHQLGVLRGQADELQRRADALDTDAEIERLAREQYSLVRPGEQAFAVLPPPAVTTPPSYWAGLLGPLGAVDAEG
ncbi:MAG: septum formation initiator family protein [Acidimicrobiales bacterium]|nr:septum formation initiator family protein [Acidimicrobiales bacterium]